MSPTNPDAFFADRGFGLSFHKEDGYTWADLVTLHDSRVFAPKYGRGDDHATAAARAVERWETEQAT